MILLPKKNIEASIVVNAGGFQVQVKENFGAKDLQTDNID